MLKIKGVNKIVEVQNCNHYKIEYLYIAKLNKTSLIRDYNKTINNNP